MTNTHTRALTAAMLISCNLACITPAAEVSAPTLPPPSSNILQKGAAILTVSRGLWRSEDRDTIWRYYETFATDIARKPDGELVSIDPFDPRLAQNTNGEWVSAVSLAFNWYIPGGNYKLNPAKKIRNSPPPSSARNSV